MIQPICFHGTESNAMFQCSPEINKVTNYYKTTVTSETDNESLFTCLLVVDVLGPVATL